jgi:hypothetical protein
MYLGRVDTGYLVANGTLHDLPAGSHLDAATGHFTWMPGPAYVGSYRLTFLHGDERILINVTIGPIAQAPPRTPTGVRQRDRGKPRD